MFRVEAFGCEHWGFWVAIRFGVQGLGLQLRLGVSVEGFGCAGVEGIKDNYSGLGLIHETDSLQCGLGFRVQSSALGFKSRISS